MTPTLTRPRPVQRNLGGRLLVGAGVAAVALVGGLLMPGLRTPAHVGRLTISNTSPYVLQVDITGEGRGGWLNLGAFSRESTRSVREVIDQGPTWVFRFSYGGREAGETVVSRAELRRNGWRLTVPDEVRDRLSAAGTAPSAFQ